MVSARLPILTKARSFLRYLALGAACATLVQPLRAAETIYDNSAHDLLTRFNPGTLEVGDQIILGGSARYLSYFSFEYWGLNATNGANFGGNVEFRVRFYLNDGTNFNGYATPDTVLWDSSWISFNSLSLGPTERSTIVFTTADWGSLFLSSLQCHLERSVPRHVR